MHAIDLKIELCENSKMSKDSIPLSFLFIFFSFYKALYHACGIFRPHQANRWEGGGGYTLFRTIGLKETKSVALQPMSLHFMHFMPTFMNQLIQ